jgi:hypothetical protein
MVWALLNPDQQSALSEITKFDSDRVTAILGGAMLEDSLRRTLEQRFRPDKDINQKIFKVSGALGNLGPKIDIAYQLHMIEKPTRNTMYGINDIRNIFAHNLSTSFESEDNKMTEAIKKLTLHEDESKYLPSGFIPHPLAKDTPLYSIELVTDNKSRYIVNLKLCLMLLMGDVVRHLKNSNGISP